jgi:hypothetical protein
MSTAASLPPTLREKLAALAWRIRQLRALRGVSLVLLLLALTAGTALAADALLELPQAIRIGLFVAWLGLGTAAVLGALIVPLSRPLRPEALAALIEEKYPDLGERLTSTVELADHPDGASGSPALITLLLQETEVRSHRLDFLQAFPTRHAGWLAAAAALVLLLTLAPAVLWPGRYAELGQRFFAPWRAPVAVVHYTLAVTPGDAIAVKGRPLAIGAEVRPLDDHAVLPHTSTLVCTDAQGTTTRRRMQADRSNAFSLALDKVAGDFAYFVEAGDAVSATYRVTAVEPIELADGSPAITITPPDYARETVEPQTVAGFADLSALQHSRVRFEFHFTRAVRTATLHWQPRGKDAQSAPAATHRLELTPDGLDAVLDLPAVADGTFRLAATGEHTASAADLGSQHLTVKPDEPPAFLKVTSSAALDTADRNRSGGERLKLVSPHDSVPLEIVVADDVGVAVAELEYTINDGMPATEAIPLQEPGSRQTTGRHVFKLLGRSLKEGDLVRYRLKAVDNRNVPEAKLGPNVTYHPADRWLTLKIANSAQPLRQQEIVAQRDEIRQRLEAIKSDLMKEQRGLYKLRQEARNQDALKPEQARDLKRLQQDNRSAENALRDLARDAAAMPAMQPLADRAQDVADKELHRSDQALHAAEKAPQANAREQRLQKADQEVMDALQRLEDLRQANERLAQSRLDQMKLEMLADRQQQLADRTAEQAERDPIKDPPAADQAEKAKREQHELAEDLQRMADQSEPLRNTLDAARGEQTKQLAEKARELAKAQRELAAAERETAKKQTEGKLPELARKQQELADQATRLAEQTRSAAQAAQTPPLKPDDARKAVEDLKQDNTGEAVRHQEAALRDLERLARNLDKAIDLARDPKEAARQLARLEEDLRQRLKEQAAKQNPKAPVSPEFQGLQREQEAIRKAARDLPVPPQNKAAADEQRQALDRAAQAARALYKPDAQDANARMKETGEALNRLADRLPSLEQRQRQAREEVAQIRRQQEEIRRQAEQAAREKPGTPEESARRLADAARKQADAAERLGKVDAPNQQARQQQAQEALNRALGDLMEARPQDVARSQQEARRQLEQLEQALAGRQPAGEASQQHTAAKPNEQAPQQQAQELAKQQRQLAQKTQEAGRQSGEQGRRSLEKVAEQQRQLTQQAAQLRPEQGQKALQQAHEAMTQAQQALDRKDATQAQQKQGEAAAQLDRLAQKAPERAQAPRPATDPPAAPPPGAPTRQQAEEATRLAKEQRELRDAVKNLANRSTPANPHENPVAEIAKQQEEVASKAEELAQNVGKDQGQKAPPTQQARQAAQSAQQASKQLQNGAVPQAQQAGRQTAQQLRQLAQEMNQTPRRQADPTAPDPVPQARDLAQRQEDLNRRMEALADKPEVQQAQQQARQQQLQNEAGNLAQELERMAQQMNRVPRAQQAARQAGNSSNQARQSMQRGQSQQGQNNQGQAQQSKEAAAKALDQAADQAARAAKMDGTPPAANENAGLAVQEAQGQMQQAEQQLSQGRNQSAQGAMQRAAQALQNAAQQMGGGSRSQAGQPNQPGGDGEGGAGGGRPGGGAPDLTRYGDDLKKYAGKRWGELPGELRTKIIQDMKSRYGDDYARIIKLYFEQLADRKK